MLRITYVPRLPADWPSSNQPQVVHAATLHRLAAADAIPAHQSLTLTQPLDPTTFDPGSACRQAVYTALKETESRATDLVPLWRLPGAAAVVPRLRRAAAAVQLIRDTTEMLIAQCRVRGGARLSSVGGNRWVFAIEHARHGALLAPVIPTPPGIFRSSAFRNISSPLYPSW